MTITKDAWIRYIYTIIITTLIHIICQVITHNRLEFSSLFNSIILGVNIWFLSEALFTLTHRIWPGKLLPGYIVLLLVIGIGTIAGSYALGVRSVYLTVVICVMAEICGFLIVLLYRNYYKKKLNEKLEAFKKN